MVFIMAFVPLFLLPSVAAGNELNVDINEKIVSNILAKDDQAGFPVYTGEPLQYTLNSHLDAGDTAVLKFDVPQDGLYEIWLSYLNDAKSYLPVSVTVLLDGQMPSSELRNIKLRSLWKDEEKIVKDRYGNEIPGIPYAAEEWQETGLTDPVGRTGVPYLFALNAGSHEITFCVNDGSTTLGQCTFRGPEEVNAYEHHDAQGDQLILLEGEDFESRNDVGIHAAGDFNAQLTPYDSSYRMLNHLSSSGFDTAGYQVTYRFTADQTGWYWLGANYRQNSRVDFPVFVDALIDGKLPSDCAAGIPFAYTDDFVRSAVQAGEENQAFYLTAGEHTLTLRISDVPLAGVYRELDAMLDEINDLSLEVIRLSGGITTDMYRDYDLLSYIPDLVEMLEGWADRCDAMYEEMRPYFSNENCGLFQELLLSAAQLRRLAEEPEDLPRRLSELSTGSNSVMNYLSQQMQKVMASGISIDQIYFYQRDAALPASTGFLASAWAGIERFFVSFTRQDYAAGMESGGEKRLQVWMARSRQYVELLQNMIDTEFTPRTGIAVDLSIMPGESKVVLANAADKAPDVVLSLAPGTPANLDIRGALKDMTQYEDFCEVADDFPSSLFVPYIYDGGVYALPETIYFCVLYYREDILEELNIPVPNTMEEVRQILPELQRRGMNFYHPSAGMGGLKYFSATLPLIMQNGGAVYGETVGATTLSSEEALKGFRELTDLFTKYNMPVDVSSGFFQQFRQGILPIGISDIWTYNQLVNAAPELDGLWNIAVIPGTVDENGDVLRWSAGNLTAMSILESTDMPDESWEFIKWFASEEVQAEYANRLAYTYGSDFLWATANEEAFKQMPIKAEHRDVILEQMQWMTDVPGVVGSYMAERELSNAFLQVVTKGVDARRALDSAIKRIDRETFRKLEEFGYYKDGEMIRELVTPTVDYVEKMIEEYNNRKKGDS